MRFLISNDSATILKMETHSKYLKVFYALLGIGLCVLCFGWFLPSQECDSSAVIFLTNMKKEIGQNSYANLKFNTERIHFRPSTNRCIVEIPFSFTDHLIQSEEIVLYDVHNDSVLLKASNALKYSSTTLQDYVDPVKAGFLGLSEYRDASRVYFGI